ncbi:MAG TPA: DUF5908 family protein [Prolixibacteraceae bacterium]|nr:DUF5908 family protein [Prolixibacteraceae bacterium]
MTLIVKELIVRGIVSADSSQINDSAMEKEELLQYLEQIRKDLERDCIEKVLQKLETKSIR